MKNKANSILIIILVLIIPFVIYFIITVFRNNNQVEDENNAINKNEESILDSAENDNEKITEESEKIMKDKISVEVKGKKYVVELEQNQTTSEFLDMLPQEFTMNELNGNEKYVYLDKIIRVEAYNPKHISSGDIMLYGNNCLVIFYKSFDTSYSYTKIGHIKNFEELGTENVVVKFQK